MSQSISRGQKCLELFATNNQSLVKKWKIHSSVKKVYDDHAKTYLYCFKGKSPNPLMHWPKDRSNAVDVPFPIIVFQFYFGGGTNAIIDIGLTSCNNLRRRITLSSNQKNERKELLSAVFPLLLSKTEMWSHVIVDVEDLVSSTWKEDELQNICSLSIGGVVNMKRIFTLRKDMIYSQAGTCLIKYDQLPKHMSLPKNASQSYLFISCSRHENAVKNKDTSADRPVKSCFSASKLTASNTVCTNNVVFTKDPEEFRHIYVHRSGSSKNSTETCLTNKCSIPNPVNQLQNEEQGFSILTENRIGPFLSELRISELIPLCSSFKKDALNSEASRRTPCSELSVGKPKSPTK